jgi:hypothetical protein
MRSRHPTAWYVSPWVIFFSVLRTATAFYILINPVWGFVWSLVFDFLDARVMLPYVHVNKLSYDMWDKIFDSVTFVAELIVALTTPYALLMTALFTYRMLGHAVFWSTKKPRVLVWFPNFFETVFFWLLIPRSWYAPFDPFTLLFFLCGVKVVHEVVLHWIWPTYIGRPWQKQLKRMFAWAPWIATFLSTDYPKDYR